MQSPDFVAFPTRWALPWKQAGVFTAARLLKPSGVSASGACEPDHELDSAHLTDR